MLSPTVSDPAVIVSFLIVGDAENASLDHNSVDTPDSNLASKCETFVCQG
jgi:hypothetical protein